MNRSKRFEQRINIERMTLEIVNTSQFAKETPLAGLTAAAINNWLERIKDYCNKRKLEILYKTLSSISMKTGLLSDNSRAVFSFGIEQDNQAIKLLLAKLAEQCRI